MSKKYNLTIKFISGEKKVMVIKKGDLDEIFSCCYRYHKSNFVNFGCEVININAIEYFVYEEVKEDEL